MRHTSLERQRELEQRAVRFYEIVFLSERPFIAMDLIRMVCGDEVSGGGARISGGASRAVYDFPLLPGTVIKITSDPPANMNEWEVWKAVSKMDYSLKKWFAPCLHVSPTGHFLIQKKVKPLKKVKLPQKVPSLFTDIKVSNWGYIGKQFVCHDYQHLENAIFHSMGSMKDVSKDWDFENIV